MTDIEDTPTPIRSKPAYHAKLGEFTWVNKLNKSTKYVFAECAWTHHGRRVFAIGIQREGFDEPVEHRFGPEALHALRQALAEFDRRNAHADTRPPRRVAPPATAHRPGVPTGRTSPQR